MILGSSPLARGLPDVSRGTWRTSGIIPARAGFTRFRRGIHPGLSDHPRSRGVYAPPAFVGSVFAGSSPLARGLRVSGMILRVSRGIIPARAGFTQHHRNHGPTRRDHPRSRGVYHRGPGEFLSPFGSSPLARGLQIVGEIIAQPVGIIPARAGFTGLNPRLHHRIPDHPRSRGVYRMAAHGACRGRGSSPLARGLRDRRRPAGR